MYKTDIDYRKGMTVAVYEGTTDGSWIARNADNIMKSKKIAHLQEINPGKIHIKHLGYHEIDWIAAGYNI